MDFTISTASWFFITYNPIYRFNLKLSTFWKLKLRPHPIFFLTMKTNIVHKSSGRHWLLILVTQMYLQTMSIEFIFSFLFHFVIDVYWFHCIKVQDLHKSLACHNAFSMIIACIFCLLSLQFLIVVF